MRRADLAVITLVLLSASCDEPTTPPIQELRGPAPNVTQGKFTHVVHVGGQDICALFGFRLGCDGNFSLVAFQYPDGSASGSWTDGPFGGNLAVKCLEVVGNVAWIGGVDRPNPLEPEAWWISRVVDAGTSANDPPDSVSRRRFAGFDGQSNPNLCHSPRPGLLDAENGLILPTMTGVPQGQVRVE